MQICCYSSKYVCSKFVDSCFILRLPALFHNGHFNFNFSFLSLCEHCNSLVNMKNEQPCVTIIAGEPTQTHYSIQTQPHVHCENTKPKGQAFKALNKWTLPCDRRNNKTAVLHVTCPLPLKLVFPIIYSVSQIKSPNPVQLR